MTDLFSAASFEGDGNPHVPSTLISLSSLPIKGETRAVPLFSSPIACDVDLTPFYVGARMLGLRSVGPQQIELASLILSERDGVPMYDEVSNLEPRRAAKTTTIWACFLGLCSLRPGFKVVTTAQTYVKARERFLDVARNIGPRNVGEFRILRGAAAEAIEWTNGSRLWVVTPEGSAFRGDGCDRVLFDESQEHDDDADADLRGGASSLMDTRFADDADLTDEELRPDGQIVVTGTAGKGRSGMLWRSLEKGRRGGHGILEYAVPDTVQVAYPVDTTEGAAGVAAGWVTTLDGKHVLNEPAVIAAHPGIGTLTTMGVIRSRFQSLPVPQFIREYGGQWPYDAASRAIDPELWEAGRRAEYPPYPLRYALGYDVAPDQSSAALCAAWRDAKGIAWIEVIEHAAGDGWLPRAIHARNRKQKGLLTGYDRIGPNRAVADRIEREVNPRPKLVDLGTQDITAAAAQVLVDLAGGTLLHVVDKSLDAAADVVTRRSIGDGSFAWGRRQGLRDGGDIAPMVAATNALRVYDTHLARTAHRERLGVVTATTRRQPVLAQ